MNKFICCARACVEPHSEAMFAYLVIRIFQLIFLIGIMFSFTINQPKQYFSLFFQRSEHGLRVGINHRPVQRPGLRFWLPSRLVACAWNMKRAG